jgi:membrane associated rhomboid family serine protease
MIQRFQTLYFVAIIFICVMACGVPLVDWHSSTEGMVRDYELNMLHFKISENGVLVSQEIQYMLIGVLAVVIGFTLYIIFSFKDRKKQMLYTKINFILILLLIVMLFAKAFMDIPGFGFGRLTAQSVVGLALLFFMLYLNFRALMLIRRDEQMVRDADRIR